MLVKCIIIANLLWAFQARAMENHEELFMSLLVNEKWADAQKMLESDAKFVPRVNSLCADLKPLHQAPHEIHSVILHALHKRGFCSLAILLHVYNGDTKIVQNYLGFEGVKPYLKKEFSSVFLDTLSLRGKI